MALERTFTELQEQLTQLLEAIQHLNFAVDAPFPSPNDLAETLRDRVPELVGLSLSAVENAANCRRSASPPADIPQLGQSLVDVQSVVNRIARRFWTDVASHNRTAELIMLTQRQDQDWRGWTLGVGQALERCQTPLVAVMESLAGCWHEILEHAGSSSISIKTTNVGPIGSPERGRSWQEVG